jgi:hypothetical protein
MNRYEWLQNEAALVPRRKFHIFEPLSPASVSDWESRYGVLPADYREFVNCFGISKLFRSSRSFFYNLSVNAPPKLIPKTNALSGKLRLIIGHYINTGDAWLEWDDGIFVDNGAIFAGRSGQRRKAACCFEEWFERSFKAAKKLYSKEDWRAILTPTKPFNEREQQIVDAIPKFVFEKVGVTSGKVLIAIENNSSIVMPWLTIGVRDRTGMEGASAVPIGDIVPGERKVVAHYFYKNSMDPHSIQVFRLPIDPEDRCHFLELSSVVADERAKS